MQKKIPMRQCMGCRSANRSGRCFEWCAHRKGTVSLDFRGKAPGRGGLCMPQPGMPEKSRALQALERNLEVPIPPEVLERLSREMEAGHET